MPPRRTLRLNEVVVPRAGLDRVTPRREGVCDAEQSSPRAGTGGENPRHTALLTCVRILTPRALLPRANRKI